MHPACYPPPPAGTSPTPPSQLPWHRGKAFRKRPTPLLSGKGLLVCTGWGPSSGTPPWLASPEWPTEPCFPGGGAAGEGWWLCSEEPALLQGGLPQPHHAANTTPAAVRRPWSGRGQGGGHPGLGGSSPKAPPPPQKALMRPRHQGTGTEEAGSRRCLQKCTQLSLALRPEALPRAEWAAVKQASKRGPPSSPALQGKGPPLARSASGQTWLSKRGGGGGEESSNHKPAPSWASALAESEATPGCCEAAT